MKFKYLFSLLSLWLFSGCLTFKTIEYELTVNKDLSAKGKVVFKGIGSDVADNEQRQLDLNGLLDYCFKSKQFVEDRKQEGRIVTNRKLYIQNNLLVGEIEFSVKSIGDIEGFYENDDYLYIDISNEFILDKSNGELIEYSGGKQVLWKKGSGKISYSISNYTLDQWDPFSLTKEYEALLKK